MYIYTELQFYYCHTNIIIIGKDYRSAVEDDTVENDGQQLVLMLMYICIHIRTWKMHLSCVYVVIVI